MAHWSRLVRFEIWVTVKDTPSDKSCTRETLKWDARYGYDRDINNKINNYQAVYEEILRTSNKTF